MKVQYFDGWEVYIMADEVMDYQIWFDSCLFIVENIFCIVSCFMGCFYFWGGIFGKGVDCFGFIKMVFYLNGLMLFWDVFQQVYIGVEVEIDIIFFNFFFGDFFFLAGKLLLKSWKRLFMQLFIRVMV